MSAPDTTSTLIPAATVILLRDGPRGLETLMLRRNRSLKSFGGAWVFPGGRVDKNDAPDGSELLRAQAASCRETHEETGLSIDIEGLVSLSHWTPPVHRRRRFSTHFFVAKAPNADVEIDEGEIHDFSWVRPSDVIARAHEPELTIFPPTYVSLHDLCAYSSVDQALSAIAVRADEVFETRFVRTDNGYVTFWKPDAGYESGDVTLPGARRRLIVAPNKWTYEKDTL